MDLLENGDGDRVSQSHDMEQTSGEVENCERPSSDLEPYDQAADPDLHAVEVGHRDYSEGALSQAVQKGGLTLKGEINLGGQMEITHNNIQDNRTINKNVHHNHGEVHQHTHNQYVKEGDVIHHHGDLHQTHHVHIGDNEAGYAQIKDQSELMMFSDDKVFVETWAFRAALEHLDQHALLLLQGPSGSGKTCTGHALLRHYKSSGFTPLILHRFEEWRAHVGGDRRQVVLLEHIFGKDQFQNATFLDWLNAFSTMQQLADSGKCVIIMTASDFVLNTLHAEHGPISLLSHSLNLAGSDSHLSEEEKREILRKHLMGSEKTVSDSVFEEIICSAGSQIFFPAQCKQFAESSADKGEYLKIFTSSDGEVFGTCGTGPKVFLKISPEMIKKSMLNTGQAAANWGYAFTFEKQDIRKAFDDNDWTPVEARVNFDFTEVDVHDPNPSHGKGQSTFTSDKDINNGTLNSTSEPREPIVQLRTACSKGNLQSVLTLLELGIDLSAKNESGFAVIHTACLSGHADIVEALLNHKSQVEATDKKYWTPLHVACLGGYSRVIELLIRHGAKVEAETFDGMRALHIACRYGHTEAIQILLQHGADINAKPNTGFKASPLHVAAYYGQADVVEMLIRFKAQIDSRDRGSWLPLHYACQEGHLKVVNIFLTHARTDQINMSQLRVDCHNGHIPFVRGILQCGIASHDPDGKTAVCRFCYLSNKLALENLSRHHICPDQPASGNVTGLFLAAQNGYYDIVNVLLEAGACTEVKMSDGWTPLLEACYKGHFKIVDLLLKYKTNVDDFLDNVLLTGLHLACGTGHREVVDVLLRHGASPDRHDNHGLSPLLWACQKGHSNVLPSLLIRVKDSYSEKKRACSLLSAACKCDTAAVFASLVEWIPNIIVNANESSILHEACRRGKLDIVKILLENDFPVTSVNDSESDGSAPLHVASLKGHPAIVEMLIKHGALANETTSNGDTALHLACEGNHIEVVKMLLENYSVDAEVQNKIGQTPLHVAANEGFVDIVTLLISSNVDVNVQDFDGMTPLVCASGSVSVVEILLESKADANILTSEKETVLHIACTGGNEAVVHSLLLRRVDTEARDSSGRTALLRACQAKRNRTNIVKLLLDNGANVDTVDDQGMTPIHVACLLGNVDLLSLLIRCGGSVNCQNEKGDTPLHEVCVQGHDHFVDTLLKAGAVINQLNNDGNTPLHHACAHLHPGIVRNLLDHGASINTRNKEGLSPIGVVQSVKIPEPSSHKPPAHLNFGFASTRGMASLRQLQQKQIDRKEKEKEIERQRKSDARTEVMLTLMEFSQTSAEQPNVHLIPPEDLQPLSEGLKSVTEEVLQEEISIGKTEISADGKLLEGGNVNMKDQEPENGTQEKLGKETRDMKRKTGEEQEDELHLLQKPLTTEQNENLITSKSKTEDKDVTETVGKGFKETGCMNDCKEPVRVGDCMIQNTQEGSPEPNKKTSSADLEIGAPSGLHEASAERLWNVSAIDGDASIACCSLIEELSSPFHKACFNGDTNFVLHHLLMSSRTDSWTKSGRTAVHYACAGGQSDIAALLIQHDADPAAKDSSGQSPLHTASLCGQLDTVDLLLTWGVDVNVADKRQSTALHLASAKGHGVIVTMLLSHGSNVHAKDNEGRTALHLAATKGHGTVVAILLSHGAKVNATDEHQNTPLLLACYGGHRDVCAVLLNFYADVEVKNQVGDNACSLVKSKNLYLLEKLIARHSGFRLQSSPGKYRKACSGVLHSNMAVVISAFLVCLLAMWLAFF